MAFAAALALASPAFAQSLFAPVGPPPTDPSAPQSGAPADLRDSLAPSLPPQGAANYGEPKPRVKLPKLNPPLRRYLGAPRRGRLALPPLEAYKNSAVARRLLRQTLKPGQAPPEIPPTVAVTPVIKAKLRPRADPEPYAPIGIGVGSLRLMPFVEVSSGYDDNPDRLPSLSPLQAIASGVPGGTNPIGSPFVRADTGFSVKSPDWDRHELHGDLRVGYVDYFDYPQASRLDGAGNVAARYDVARDTAIDVTGRVAYDTLRPYSQQLIQSVTATTSGTATTSTIETPQNRPSVVIIGTTAGVTQKFSRLEVTLRGSYDRVMYGDAYYTSLGPPPPAGPDANNVFRLSSTSYNDFGGTARVAYEVDPHVKPFAEATYDIRAHDSYLDPYGEARDSNGVLARGGVDVKFSDLLRGDASGGYVERNYAQRSLGQRLSSYVDYGTAAYESQLPQLRGPTVDADLIYTPTPLTTLTLRAATTISETTVTGASGVFSHGFSAQLSHDLLRNLNITALGTYYTNNYQGAAIVEHGYTAGVKLDYKLTRSLSLRASYSHERLNSSYGPIADYTANVYTVGLRFQQ
ncbi:MAG TPA: outer membrane beta-barrel protein [Methylocystis sp.]|nr:outer membrane beta-barrel protein [Methylocystis sp.]